MQLLQDHLITAVAAFGILLATGELLHQRALDAAQQARLMGGQAALAAFTEVLEQDLRSIGSGVPTGTPMVLEAEADRFVFQGTADATETTRTIAYERAAAAPGPGGEPRYTVTRYVDGVPGPPSPLLTAFDVALRDAEGLAVGPGTLEAARRVRVRLEMPPPFEGLPADGQAVRRLAWESELVPSNLARRQIPGDAHPLLPTYVALTSFGS
jgi:hypothetical protein